MKNLFICWRPIQIINALYYVFDDMENCRGNSDLIVVNDFYESKEIACRLRETKLFRNVYFVEMEKNRSVLDVFLHTLFPGYFLKKKLGKTFDYQYDQLIASGWNYLVYKFVEANHHKLKVIFSEDGIGSYLGDARFFEFIGPRQRLMKTLLNRGPFSVKIAVQYVALPELCDVEKYDYPIEKLKIDFENKRFVSLVDQVFLTQETQLDAKGKCIILDQLVDNNLCESNSRTKIELYTYISDYLKNVRLICRKHPNDHTDEIEKALYMEYDDSRHPWELIALHSIHDKDILVSFHSTSTVVPKLTFGKEPYVICLYKLMDFTNTDEIIEVDLFFQKVRSQYAEPEKIIIPETIDALRDQLIRLSPEAV